MERAAGVVRAGVCGNARTEKRLAGAYAGTPTWKEQGITGTFNTWRGLWAPKGLSA